MNIQQLLNTFANLEANLTQMHILAPRIAGGRIRVKLAGLIQTLIPQPNTFSGWGIFQPTIDRHAQLLRPATLPQIDNYLQLLPKLRLHLIESFQTHTWFAYPVNLAEAQHRFKMTSLVPIHLVTEGQPFDTIIARLDGATWWFDGIDRRANPRLSHQLRQALQSVTHPNDLQFPHLTPELRTTYQLAAQHSASFVTYYQQQRQHWQTYREQVYAQQRLSRALAMGGGELHSFQDRGDYWLVDWHTTTGTRHTSAIAKSDLTVISAGICLDGRDRDFDLHSLVGVVENME